MREQCDEIRINNGQWLLVLLTPIALLGKLVRWTLLKASLVDMGVGHGMGPSIVTGHPHFELSLHGGNATSNANFIFSPLKYLGCTTYWHFELAITIIYNAIILLIIYDFVRRNNGVSMAQFIVIAFFIGVLNVYTFTLAKEPAQMLYFMMMYPVLRSSMANRSKWVWCIIIILFTIVSTRTYLVLMLMFAIIFKYFYPFLYRHLNSNTATLLSVFILSGIVYYLFLNVMQDIMPNDFQELIRVRLRESDATTDIRAVIPSKELELFSVNYIITSFRLLFPIEMISFGPKYMLCALFQIIVSWALIKYTLHFGALSDSRRLAVCLFWGFLFCSAAFEPDFGSWIRHESVTFPFLMFAFDNNIIGDNEALTV